MRRSETEKRVLANAEKLYTAAMSAYDQLYEGTGSAEGALRAAIRNVEELARYDARFNDMAQQLSSARATIGDAGATLRDYAEGINASPERFAEIEDRLAALERLKPKYGQSVADVIAFGERCRPQTLRSRRPRLEPKRRFALLRWPKRPPPTNKPQQPSPPIAKPRLPNSPNSPRHRSMASQ